MYSFNSRIRYSEVGGDKLLSLNGIINYFQDCSTFQSEELNVGVGVLEEQHRIWVLSSWQIVVERYPALCEEVRISTWPYYFQGFCGYRNFTMKDSKGLCVGRKAGYELCFPESADAQRGGNEKTFCRAAASLRYESPRKQRTIHPDGPGICPGAVSHPADAG